MWVEESGVQVWALLEHHKPVSQSEQGWLVSHHPESTYLK